MRLFIAINFSSETKKQLMALCDELRKTSIQGRFSLQENLHLTLAFIGEYSSKQVSTINLAKGGDKL